jgi:hypothetical protein
MKRIGSILTIVWLVIAAGWALAQAPVPVAERLATHLGRTTRVSLFSNRVAVVSVTAEGEDFVQQALLSDGEYMVYLQALERLAGQLGGEPVSSQVESRDSSTRLTLYVGSQVPRTITYSPLAVLNLAAGKVAAIMDDIQTRVLETRPGEDAVRMWQPEVGDTVTLLHGGSAQVTEIAENGTIVLIEDKTGMIFTVAPEDRASVIREPVPPSP